MWRHNTHLYCGELYIDYNIEILPNIEGRPLRFPTKITSPQGCCDYIEITDFNGLAIGTRYVYVEQHDEMFNSLNPVVLSFQTQKLKVV